MPGSTPRLYLVTIIAIMTAMIWGCREDTDLPGLIPHTKDTLLIYIMAGQSNMAGRGAIEPQDTVTNPRILSVDSAGNLVMAREPLHFYHPAFSGLDCGMSFAGSMLPYIPAGSRICLVPCAISSTSVQDWLGDSLRGVKVYTNMSSRAQIAMQHGILKGILWHQGEANAADSTGAAHYAADLEAFIRKIRKDLQDDRLPFFAATLADFCRRPFKDTINAAIRRVSNTLPHTIVISTGDLSCKPDSIHFDAAGQREMGRRFAEAARVFLR